MVRGDLFSARRLRCHDPRYDSQLWKSGLEACSAATSYVLNERCADLISNQCSA